MTGLTTALKCFLLTIIMSTPSVECAIEEITWREDPSIRNLTFSKDLIFSTVDARSVLDCGRRCSRTEHCVTFTFTRHSTSSGTCRGHSSLMTSQSPGSATIDTQGYVLSGRKMFLKAGEKSQWAGRACSSEAECPAENSTCFYQHCLCIPGYYFSHSANNCVPKCAPGDLQTTFMQYPRGLLNHRHGVLHHESEGLSLGDCQALCVKDPACRGIDFLQSKGMCMTLQVTPLDHDGVTIMWLPDVVPHFYSQLTCA